jgi:hypothetical protein
MAKVLSRHQTISTEPTSQRPGLPLLEPVALGAEIVDLVEHPIEKRLGRVAGYPGALKLRDLSALEQNLKPQTGDLASDKLDVRRLSPRPLDQNTQSNAREADHRRAAAVFRYACRSEKVGRGSLPPAALHSATNEASSARIAISFSDASVQSWSRLIWSRIVSSTAGILALKSLIFRRISLILLSMGLLEQNKNIESSYRLEKG